ncbi:hypothetical protein P0D69_41570 [Paraburkholderia sediminicola]|uniref:hypothetical protein n=1 Tax=Paraburkholderia sediminicola TaxID=458836 RepID=UPI0038BC37AA
MSVIALSLQRFCWRPWTAPQGGRRCVVSALADTPFAVSLTACGGASRCAEAMARYRPGVTRQMPLDQQQGIAPDPG